MTGWYWTYCYPLWVEAIKSNKVKATTMGYFSQLLPPPNTFQPAPNTILKILKLPFITEIKIRN